MHNKPRDDWPIIGLTYPKGNSELPCDQKINHKACGSHMNLAYMDEWK